MPSHVLMEVERKPDTGVVPGPIRREIGHDRGKTVLRDVLIEHDEIVENTHHWPLGNDRGFLMDRHARRAVDDVLQQDSSLLLRERDPRRGHHNQERESRNRQARCRCHVFLPGIRASRGFSRLPRTLRRCRIPVHQSHVRHAGVGTVG